MKTLVNSALSIGATEIIIALMAIIKNKYLAIHIGPEGFGTYALLNSFFLLIAVFAGTWINSGVIKYMSEYSQDGKSDEQDGTFAIATAIVLSLGLLLSTALILNSTRVIDTFLSPKIPRAFYILFAASLVWTNLRLLFQSALQGLMQVRCVVVSRLLSALVNLALIVMLVYAFNILGFFISILVSSVSGAAIIFFLIRRYSELRFTRISFRSGHAKKLLTFGAITLMLSLLNLGSQYLQRLLLTEKFGLNAVGLFQAAVSIMEYINLASRSGNFYYFPKMSELMPDELRIAQLNEYLFFVMISSVPICVCAVLFGDVGIKFLYSYRFASLSSSLWWFVLGAFLAGVVSAFQYVLLGTARLAVHSVSVFLVHLAWVLIPYLLLDMYGISAMGIAFLIGSVIGLCINVCYLRRAIGLTISLRNIALFIVGVLALIVARVNSHFGISIRILVMISTIAGLSLFLSGKERSALLQVVSVYGRKAIRRSES